MTPEEAREAVAQMPEAERRALADEQSPGDYGDLLLRLAARAAETRSFEEWLRDHPA